MDTVQGLYRRFVKLVSHHQTKENESLRIGGEDVEVEADESAFRCTGVRLADGSFGVQWIRYFGMVARGSSKMFLQQIPDRDVRGAGQSGGGALSVEELKEVVKVEPDDPAINPPHGLRQGVQSHWAAELASSRSSSECF